MEIGVEITSAQGQAITSSTSARSNQSPQSAPKQRRQQRHGNGPDDDGRRVDAREAVHQPLGRRAARLRLLDQLDDARHRRVAPPRG